MLYIVCFNDNARNKIIAFGIKLSQDLTFYSVTLLNVLLEISFEHKSITFEQAQVHFRTLT